MAGKAYDMTSLLHKYKFLSENQGVEPDNYTRQHLRQRLKNHFGDKIVFHQPPGRSQAELVYSSSISLQSIINEAFRRSNDADVSMTGTPLSDKDKTSIPDDFSERTKILYKAVMIIKSDINSTTGIPVQPLHLNDITTKTCKQVVPESLYWLLRWIISASETFELNPQQNVKILPTKGALSCLVKTSSNVQHMVVLRLLNMQVWQCQYDI